MTIEVARDAKIVIDNIYVIISSIIAIAGAVTAAIQRVKNLEARKVIEIIDERKSKR